MSRDELGRGIAVCLRDAIYAPLQLEARRAVADVVLEAASRWSCPVLPTFVSHYRQEDRRATLPLFEGYERLAPPLGRYAGARAVATRVSEARIVVTGPYHLAVFALSQGIPVVGLTSSRYYDDKFAGLKGMFGSDAVAVQALDDPDLRTSLSDKISQYWTLAPDVRDAVRRRAAGQIMASREAHDRAFQMVQERRPGDRQDRD